MKTNQPNYSNKFFFLDEEQIPLKKDTPHLIRWDWNLMHYYLFFPFGHQNELQ